MESIKRKESRENGICRHGLQIESCRKCLFDALCSYEDNQNEIKARDSEKARMDSQENRTTRE